MEGHPVDSGWGHESRAPLDAEALSYAGEFVFDERRVSGMRGKADHVTGQDGSQSCGGKSKRK